MRIEWTQNGSNVDVGFTAKGPGKTVVQVSHGKSCERRRGGAPEGLLEGGGTRLRSRLESMFEPLSGLH